MERYGERWGEDGTHALYWSLFPVSWSHLLKSRQQTFSKPDFWLLLLTNRSSLIRPPLSVDMDERGDLACMCPEGKMALSEVSPAGFQVWHQLRTQRRGNGEPGCETLLIKLGSRDQFRLLLLYQNLPAAQQLSCLCSLTPFVSWWWNSTDLCSWGTSINYLREWGMK